MVSIDFSILSRVVVQRGQAVQYCSYGDGIFPINAHTIGEHFG